MHSRTPSMTSINSAYTGANATYGTVPAGRGRSSNDEGYNFPTMTRGQGRSLQQKILLSLTKIVVVRSSQVRTITLLC